MNNLIQRFKHYLARPKGFKRLDIVEKACISSFQQNKVLNDNIIALARLSFIDPKRLYEESINIKANTDYLVKLVEAKSGNK